MKNKQLLLLLALVAAVLAFVVFDLGRYLSLSYPYFSTHSVKFVF